MDHTDSFTGTNDLVGSDRKSPVTIVVNRGDKDCLAING
jgi:hypothetical protein